MAIKRGNSTFSSLGVEAKYDRFTSETRFAVYGYGIYESGVLKGRSKRVFLDSFDTEEEAYKAYPEAHPSYSPPDLEDDDRSLADMSGLPSTPPDDFDYLDAGERWDDDY